MTGILVSQVAAEVLRLNTSPDLYVSQVATEVLRLNTASDIYLSQLAIEVLRPNVALTSTSTIPTTVCISV